MQLNAYQERMLKGEMGASRAWAMQFQLDTGRVLSAESLTPIRYAFFMADTDAMGKPVSAFWKNWPKHRRPNASHWPTSIWKAVIPPVSCNNTACQTGLWRWISAA
ncbi:aconitase X [Aliamphritea spongicola]|nr:aconitase X [Aliamphritea spongicola]